MHCKYILSVFSYQCLISNLHIFISSFCPVRFCYTFEKNSNNKFLPPHVVGNRLSFCDNLLFDKVNRLTSINLLLLVMIFSLVVMLMALSWTHLWMSLKCWQQNWTQWFSSGHRGNTASLFLLGISQIIYKPLTILSCAAVIHHDTYCLSGKLLPRIKFHPVFCSWMWLSI